MASQEFVTVTINGIPFASWQSFSATANAESPERTFQVKGSIERGVALTFKEGDECSVASNGDLIVTGFVTKISRHIAEKVEITLDGKSKGADMAKGSVDHDTHEWRKKDIVEVAKSADPSGTKYWSDEKLDKIEVCRANVGQKCLPFVDKLARKQRLFLTGQADGSVKIGRHCKQTHTGGIIEGENFFEGTITTSDEERFNEYKVKGHQPVTTGEKNFRYEEKANDAAVRKGPIKVLTPRTALSRKEAKDVANHAADTRHGDSVTLECTLQGFRDMGGKLWEPGWLVYCFVPSGTLAQVLAIKSVTFSQDETKSDVKLSLVHPSALGGGQSGSKAGSSGDDEGFSGRE